MRLRHHWLAGGGPAVSYGFMDQTTTASFSFNANPGSIEFWIQAEGSTPAAREIASAWLDAVEASVRRPPDYAEPVGGPTGEEPGANPDGVPYLRDFDHSGEVFEGGRTYAIPGSNWLVDIPKGIRVTFQGEVTTPHGGNYCSFEDIATGDHARFNIESGNGGGVGTLEGLTLKERGG